MSRETLSAIKLPLIFTICFIWAFFSGFLIHKYAVASPSSNSGTRLFTKPNTPQEEYDLVVITNEVNPKILILDYVVDTNKFYGNARYFDGTEWAKKSLSLTDITLKDGLLPIDDNYIDNTEISLNLTINKTNFKTSACFALNMPMVIKSRKTFTKFGGAINTTGAQLSINGVPTDAKLAFLKAFNYEKDTTSEIDLGVQSKWFVYWDDEGNFYHLDNSEVTNPTVTYQSHDFLGVIYGASEPQVDYFSSTLSVSDISENSFNVAFKYNNDSVRYEYTLSDYFKREGFDIDARGAIMRGSDNGIGVYLDLGFNK